MLTRRTYGLFTASAITALTLTGAAGAQNALGDGTALDSNLEVGSGGRNRPAAMPDYRLRNLLITGDVTSGRGFRGTVGYTAPEDFRGAAGSEDLFSFRAESALSTLSYVSLGRSYQPLAFGQDVGLLEYRNATVGGTLNLVEQDALLQQERYNEFLEAQGRLDRMAMEQLSEAGFFQMERRPETVSFFNTPDGQTLRISASALRGLQGMPVEQDVSMVGLTLYDQARIVEDAIGGVTPAIGSPFALDMTLYEGGDEDEADGRIGEAADQRIGLALSADYDTVMQSVRDRFSELDLRDAEARETGGGLDDEFTALRDYLQGRLPVVEPEEGDETVTPDATLPPGVPILPPDMQTPPGQRQTPPPGELPRDLNIEMLRHGRVVENIAPEEQDSRLAEVLADAETELRNRSFFAAEREFVRVLRMKPNHPLATGGLANAQIGAGIPTAAAITLRDLFTRHPEMIDVRYSGTLLPPDERLDSTVKQMRDRVAEDRANSGNGLILAYIGKQTQDEAMIREGLDLMADLNERDPLVPVLRAVWLGPSDGGG